MPPGVDTSCGADQAKILNIIRLISEIQYVELDNNMDPHNKPCHNEGCFLILNFKDVIMNEHGIRETFRA